MLAAKLLQLGEPLEASEQLAASMEHASILRGARW
jgi:hypothetical protein